MKFLRPNFETQSDENVFWASMSDLLLGLTIVFIVLFALAMTGLTKQSIQNMNTKSKITKQLANEFQKRDIPVDIDKLTGNIKISDLELFELNKWTISDKGKKYLNQVVPIYFDTILGDPEISKNISQIIIEGHTDSQSFSSAKSEEENYTKNLELSIKRAYAVSSFVINQDYKNKDKYKGNLLKLLSTNGSSYSSPVIVNGKEDFTKSRRVELKFQLKDYTFIDLIKKYKFEKPAQSTGSKKASISK